MSLLFSIVSTASADVSVGDVIDENNWQKIEGLVPNQIVEMVKKGGFPMKIGKIEYDLGTHRISGWIESYEKHRGKWDVDEDGLMIDPKTGKYPAYPVIGCVFPDLDPKDPKMVQKYSFK